MNTKRREKISFSENDINYIAYQRRQMNIKTNLSKDDINQLKGTGHFFETLPVGCVPDGTDNSQIYAFFY